MITSEEFKTLPIEEETILSLWKKELEEEIDRTVKEAVWNLPLNINREKIKIPIEYAPSQNLGKYSLENFFCNRNHFLELVVLFVIEKYKEVGWKVDDSHIRDFLMRHNEKIISSNSLSNISFNMSLV